MNELTLNAELCVDCMKCERNCPNNAIHVTNSVPLFCMHCSPDKAPCLQVCSEGAIENADSVAEKCNRCADRAEGPACIKACSKRAIAIVDTDNLKAQKQAAYIAKLAGKTKKKNNGFVNIITSGSRVNKTYEE